MAKIQTYPIKNTFAANDRSIIIDSEDWDKVKTILKSTMKWDQWIQWIQGIQWIAGNDWVDGAVIYSTILIPNNSIWVDGDWAFSTAITAEVFYKTGWVRTLVNALRWDTWATGVTGATIVSGSFVGNDLVFVKSDASTVTIVNAKVDLKWDKWDKTIIYSTVGIPSNWIGVDWDWAFDTSSNGNVYYKSSGTWTLVNSYRWPAWDDWKSPVSASFVWNDMVFVYDDASTISIVNAKITLTWPAWTNGIDWASFVPKWPYSSLTTYVENDVVSYLWSSWVALQNTLDNIPSEWVYWTLNASKWADWTGAWDFMADGTVPMSWDLNMNSKNILTPNTIKLKTNPTIWAFEEWKVFYDSANKTISAMIDTDITMQIGQEELVLVYNNTGSTILNGKCVYPTWANWDMPTVALAKADNEITAKTLWMTTQDIPNNSSGFVTVRGIIHNTDTSSFSAWQELRLSPTTAGEHTSTMPTNPAHIAVRIGRVLLVHATTGSIYVRQIYNNRLTDLTDVTVASPLVDQVLKYNGTEWINWPQTSASAWAWISFFLDDTTIIPAGAWPQTIPLYTLSKTPLTATPEEIDSVTVNNNTLLIERYLFNTPLWGTQIDWGIWTFNHYCSVNNTWWITTIPVSIRRAIVGAGTVTITGTWTNRTATVTWWTPFIAWDATADITLWGLLQTPNGCFKITWVTCTSVVTITTLSTYTNESLAAYSKHEFLFADANTDINNTVVWLVTSLSPQPAFTINPTDKLSVSYFWRTDATANRTVNLYHNWTNNYTHFTTPLVVRHNDLAWLQWGTSWQYNHLTNAQLTVVQNTSWTNTWDQTLPVKATWAEIDTWTDDVKFATAKAISDSKLSYTDWVETLTNKTITDAKTIQSINAQTWTTYTLVLTDASKLITSSNAANQTITVPPNSSVAFPIWTQIDLIQIWAGKVTLAQWSWVTISSKWWNKSTNWQYVWVSLIKVWTDLWYLVWDLVA